MTNQIAVIENKGIAINREQVVEFGETLMGIHPGATEIGLQGMRTIAQLALVTGANPLPGTNGIHAWRDKKGKLCIKFGIGYWRTQAELEGGVLWVDRPRPMTDTERKYYGITKEQTASICTASLKKSAFRLMNDCREYGIEMSLKDAKQEVGRTGVGVVNPNEYAKKGRSPQWSADKRAETDLLGQLVPAMSPAFQNAQSGASVDGGVDWSAGEFVHLQTGEELGDDYGMGDANGDLFDDDIIDTEESSERGRAFSDIVAGNGDDVPEGEVEQLADDEAQMKRLPEHSIEALRETIEGGTDGKVTLGFICNRATMTGLYKNTGEHDMSKHAFKAALKWEAWPEDNGAFKKADLHNGSIMPAEKGLALFDWLVERKQEAE